MKSIAVYCGSSAGKRAIYAELAKQLGQLMATRSIKLVYGGGKVGLMGIVADAVMDAGGEVLGVIPGFLNHKEIGHTGITELQEVESMHERKMIMFNESDGFIAMPGGFGTMDELFEILTWAQLGLHPKPIGILNVAGYYDPFIQHVDQMMNEGFLKPIYRHMLVEAATPEALLEAMDNYVAPEVEAWLKPSTT